MNTKLLISLVCVTVFLLASSASGQNSSGVCSADSQCSDQCGKAKYLQDPNAYPSPFMGRYQFIRSYYAFLRFLARCYYALVNAAFALLNAFKPVEHVQWNNASSLLFIPAHKAAKLIRQRQLTSTDLVSAYIARIKAINGLTNGVHNDNFDNALQLAQQYDQQIANMSDSDLQALANSKPLFGVPFTSKANLMAKGFVTHSCNRYLMSGSPSDVDAPILGRIKDAGGVLLGITAMPNLGLSWAGDDTACGQVNNPHDARRISGGSSAGEGVTISSAGSLFGIGNDIGGSVRVPSHINGIFGLKPTNYPNHTVPVEGIVPNFCAYKPGCDMLTNGPLVRYASDLEIVLSVMAGQSVGFFNRNVNFTNDVKIYYLEDHDVLISEPLHDEQRDAVRKVKNYFEQTYNLSVQKIELPLMNRLFELWGLQGWTPGHINLSDVIPTFWDIYNGVANTTFLSLEFDLIKAFTAAKDEKEFAFGSAKLVKFRREVSKLLGKNAVLLLPMNHTPVPYHNMEPFTSTNLIYAMTWNLLGNPALAAPIGKSDETNMPLGVQFVANHHNEALLVAFAKEMEKAFGGWVQPGKP